MNKNNKRKSAVAAMALTLLVGAGSLAYFTDQKFGEVKATAANVSLGEVKSVELTKLLVPGDNISFEDQLSAVEYTGNVDARYRLGIGIDGEDSLFPYETDKSKPGYHLIDKEGNPVALGDQMGSSASYLLRSGEVKAGESIEIGGGEKGYTLHLNEGTGNEFQDKAIKFGLRVDVLQKDNTTDEWKTMSDVEINIVEK